MRSWDIYHSFGIDQDIIDYCFRMEWELIPRYREIDAVSEFNSLKVIRAMQEEKISGDCMGLTTGYGYSDYGRDALEAVYARIFHAEDAILRSQLISGTHALTVALFGLLRPGDSFLSPAGLPYDTLCTVIGLSHESGSLADFGIGFDHVELLPDGSFDLEAVSNAIDERTRLILIQRSRGYTLRRSFSVDDIRKLIRFVKGIRNDIICLVDNCYGEYTDYEEPVEAGADIVIGSLIKNPGGGIAPVGGYIVGKKEYIELAAMRMTAPGLGKEVGPSLGLNRLFYQGTYLAPSVTASALKGAALAALVYNRLGFKVSPAPGDKQNDIIAAINLGSPERVRSFVRAIQAAAAVDSFVEPVPSPMPGYSDEIIMASGSFISGSSIELSADAPMRPPYTVFLQGGLSFAQCRLGVMMSLNFLLDDGLIDRSLLK